MKRIHWYDHLSINLFWLGLNIRNTAVGSVFMPYLVAIFVRPDIKNTALGGMNTAGLIIAMLVQPLAGLLSDRSTSRFGRRRPFIFFGVIFDLVFLAAIGLSGSYSFLLVAILFQQFSANVSHGPLQGLIPDLVPEDQRGRSAGVKAIFELLPLIIIPFTIAKLVESGNMSWAVVSTGAGLLLIMLLTMFFVKEQPLKEKPTTSLREPMMRVLGILSGICVGAAVGLLAGGILGGLGYLIAQLFVSIGIAQMIGISLFGAIAMIVAVVVGVWAGSLASLGHDRGSITGLWIGLLLGIVVFLVTWYLSTVGIGLGIGIITCGITTLIVALIVDARYKMFPTLREDASLNSNFTWWVVNRLLFLAAVTSIQRFAMYFIMSAFGVSPEKGVGMSTQLIMVVGIFTIVSALLGGILSSKFGNKRLVSISGIVAFGGTLLLLVTTIIPNLMVMYVAGIIIGLGAGLFMTTNWALGTALAPGKEAGRYLGISNLAGAGAGMIGTGIGGPVADLINRIQPGMGYFVIFACFAILFGLSTVSLLKIKKDN